MLRALRYATMESGSDDPGSKDMFTLPLESSQPSSRGNLTCRGKERKRRPLPISERLLSFVGQSSRIKIQNTQLWVIPKTIKKELGPAACLALSVKSWTGRGWVGLFSTLSEESHARNKCHILRYVIVGMSLIFNTFNASRQIKPVCRRGVVT